MTADLRALHAWLRVHFPSLEAVEKQDAHSSPYLSVRPSAVHPVLATAPSVHLNIYVKEDLLVSKLMAFNLIPLREVSSTQEEEMNGEGKMNEILRVISGQQTSVCVGIPEEALKARDLMENLNLVMIEKFLNCVVVRSRTCDRVILEQDDLYLCSSCLQLQQKLEDRPGDAEENNEDVESSEMEVKMEPEVEMNDMEAEEVPHSIFNSEPLRKMSKLVKTKLSCPEDSCDKKFGKYKLLVNHCRLKHGYSDQEMPVKLENIKIELEALKSVNQTEVTKHKVAKNSLGNKSEKKSASERFTCQYCPKMFKFQSSLTNHTKRYHTETMLVPCEHCGKEVKQSNMDMHYKNNHATPRYTCNQCGKTFYFKALMVNHIAVMHEGQKNHVCDLCGAKFGIKKSLERHVRCQHEDYRPHICEYCQKAFHTLQKLQKHISGHIKDKLYVCPVCEAKFYYQDNVRMHVKKSHPDHDPKVKCRVIDNPDYEEGQGVYSMASGRRMRVNNSKQRAEGGQQSSPAYNQFTSYSRPNSTDTHQPTTTNSVPASSANFVDTNSPFYGEQKHGETGERDTTNIPQLNAQPQLFDQTRPADFSNYLLGLRYNYANYHQQ